MTGYGIGFSSLEAFEAYHKGRQDAKMIERYDELNTAKVMVSEVPNSSFQICDRCMSPYIVKDGGKLSTITYTMYYDRVSQVSESITISTCVNCYELMKKAAGVEMNGEVLAALKRRERSTLEKPALPRIVFDTEGEKFDKRLEDAAP